ncbi:MAG: hypothetical protein H5U03_00465 [Clostridia bacterium]|nr:hypothetical protein [Clostridia bacterium]
MHRLEAKAHTLLAFLCHPKPVRRYLYISKHMSKELKRRMAVCDGGKLVSRTRYRECANCEALQKVGWELIMLANTLDERLCL